MKPIVVIGAGQAGASLVAKLRQLGHSDGLILIGDEPRPPYQRPPLSKGYLLGDMSVEQLLLRPQSFYADQNIELWSGKRVEAIDPLAKTVKIDGQIVEYHQLALTTGSVPRRLPSPANASGVYTVRNLADVDAMAKEFQAGRRVLIVGGGYIGLEAAAVAAKLGLEVTLIEMAPRILQRVAAPETAAFFRKLHEGHGVRILEGVGLERLVEDGGRVTGALLSNGQNLSVDFVIAGVGIAPATGLAEAAGLRVENGIWTDVHGRTSDPAVWAAGDCASFPWNGGRLRLESVGHAIDHAECVASNMLGIEKPYTPKPWFWSDQYDVKLQIAGLNQGYDSVVIRQGAGEQRSIWYYRGEQLLAVDAINDPRSFMVARRILEAGQTVERSLVQDVNIDVKQLLAAATRTCDA